MVPSFIHLSPIRALAAPVFTINTVDVVDVFVVTVAFVMRFQSPDSKQLSQQQPLFSPNTGADRSQNQ